MGPGGNSEVKLAPSCRIQAVSKLVSESTPSAFWLCFPGCSPQSALQNVILLFCNLLCTVIVQDNFSFPCFPCSVTKWCSLEAEVFWLPWKEHLGTDRRTPQTATHLQQLLQSLLWPSSSEHHADRLLPGGITAHCCQHLPSRWQWQLQKIHLALIKNKGCFFFKAACLEWYSNNCQGSLILF